MSPAFLNDKDDKVIHKSLRPFSERMIFPVLEPSKLLVSVQRKKILADIRHISQAPDQPYQSLYQSLIDNFVKFVQVLPVNNEARLCSLMDEGLMRGLFVLQLQKAESDPTLDPLMTYMLFSAALLFDVGNVIENRTVSIANKQGDFIREWIPYLGAMGIEDGYYRIRRGGGIPPWLSRRVTAILARQLMPEIGFRWIAKDAYAFNSWLSLLYGEKEGLGTLSIFFNRALELLEELKVTQEFYIPLEVETLEPDENKLAEDFLEWLRQSVEDGSLTINKNDSLVHVVEDGLLLKSADLFKKFLEVTKQSVVFMSQLAKQLDRLGMLHGGLNEMGYKFASVFERTTVRAVSAMTRGLFKQGKAAPTTGVAEKTATSKIESTAKITAQEKDAVSKVENASKVEGAVKSMATSTVAASSPVILGVVLTNPVQILGNAQISVNQNLQPLQSPPPIKSSNNFPQEAITPPQPLKQQVQQQSSTPQLEPLPMGWGGR
jgi:hypothetical protein